MEELLRMGPSQLSHSVFIRRDVKETGCRDEQTMLVFDVPWVLTNPSVAWLRERAIRLMKRVCHLSQSYYTPRKQTVSIISLQKKDKICVLL